MKLCLEAGLRTNDLRDVSTKCRRVLRLFLKVRLGNLYNGHLDGPMLLIHWSYFNAFRIALFSNKNIPLQPNISYQVHYAKKRNAIKQTQPRLTSEEERTPGRCQLGHRPLTSSTVKGIQIRYSFMSIFLLPRCGPANWEKSGYFCTVITTKNNHGKKKKIIKPLALLVSTRVRRPSSKADPARRKTTTALFFQLFLLQTAARTQRRYRASKPRRDRDSSVGRVQNR